MVKLIGAFSRLRPFRALVLGDFMLDVYTTGFVKRISPEAPVPVMEVLKRESRPGGAGNVVLNLLALGGEVVAIGRIGDDEEGQELKKALLCDGVDGRALFIEPGYRTPLKNRLIANSQQLLRVDREEITPLQAKGEEEILCSLASLIPQVQIVALSDYGKGFLTERIIEAALALARQAQIPTIVDPKGINFTKYRGARVLKPNLSEAYAAAKMPLCAPLSEVAAEIFRRVAVDLLLITRSEAGMSLFDAKGRQSDFPVRSKEVKDVTGAGDTVLATLCLALANGLEMESAAQLANIAAGISIERLGCAQVTLSEFAQRLLEFDTDTKIFDETHAFVLHQILNGKGYSLLTLQKGQTLVPGLFQTIRNLSRERELIVYVSDSSPSDDFIHLLSSIQGVRYVVVQRENLEYLYRILPPHKVYALHGGEAIAVKEEDVIFPPPRHSSLV